MNAEEEGRPAPVVEPSAGWSRRHFLPSLGSAAAAAAVWPTAVDAAPRRTEVPRNPRIAIIGGGMAGLNAAYQLKKRGIASTVYESRSRVGGRMFTVRDAFGPGSVTDVGAELVNTNHSEIIGLAQEFGIGLFDRATDAAATGLPVDSYLIDGRVVPDAEVARGLRALARRIGRDAAKLDADPDRYTPVFDNLSARAYLDQNADLIPSPWVRELIEESVRTEYGVEPEGASSLVFLYNLPTVNGQEVEILSGSDERYLIEGGSGSIPEAVAASLGAAVRTGFACRSISRGDDGYSITFANGQKTTADILICALPWPVLRRLDVSIPFPAEFGRFIEEVELGANEKVIAGFTDRFWRTQGRFANEFWSTEEFASGWDASQRGSATGGGVLTFFTGGDGALAALRGSVGQKAAGYVSTFSGYYPEARARYTRKALRSGWLTDPNTLGAYANFAPGQTTRFAAYTWYEDPADPASRQEVRFGNAYFIGEQTSSEFYGFMNGAAETGRLAAESVLRQLGAI
jgi:monoamine oxidase